MNTLFKRIDELLDRIPEDLRDLIQKAMIALGAIIALFGILSGIIRGIRDAEPAGFQVAKDSNNLFYLDRVKEDNKSKNRLVEDIEYDIDLLMKSKLENKKLYRSMSRNTLDHLKGERDEFIVSENKLRTKSNVPNLLDGEVDNILLKLPDDQSKDIHSKMSVDPVFNVSSSEGYETIDKVYDKIKIKEIKDNVKFNKKSDLNFIE